MNRFVPDPPCGKEAVYAMLCGLTKEACDLRDDLEDLMHRVQAHKQRIEAVRDELKNKLTEQP